MKSMTGFGRARADGGGIGVEVELCTVNRKQLDVRINLPRGISVLESRIQELIRSRLSRGALTGSVKMHESGRLKKVRTRVDRETAAAFMAELRRVSKALRLQDDLTAASLLSLPGVLLNEEPAGDVEAVWKILKKAILEALKNLDGMRTREGQALSRDLSSRNRALGRRVADIQRLAPQNARRYRTALLARLQQAGVPVAASDPALLKELALFADRCDISEEIVRLGSHLDQMTQMLSSREPVGRPLDFLCQEIFREINTIGSKANDARISRHVVHFKAELEAMREQIQNIE